MHSRSWSRRRVLGVSASAIGLFALAPAAQALSAFQSPEHQPADTFDDLEGERVRLVTESGERFAARITEVQRRSRRSGRVLVEETTVLFRTGLREDVPQGMFRVQHSGDETIPLLLAPVVTRARGRHYEAVFTRIV